MAGITPVLAGYDLSRDEQMAVFDSRIYAAGRLAWPLPQFWRSDALVLNLLFMLPVAHPVAWVSGYLPGHALLRAGIGRIADPALTGPLLSALSLPLLWGVARRLWPDRGEPAVVALLFLLVSGQFWMTGMSAFAMPAHLAFNLTWLWLFLRDRRGSDWAALAVGFGATGLHQPLFHPLFVLPWLALLFFSGPGRPRPWRRVMLFAVGYALIGGFWLAWPHVTMGLVSGPGSVIEGPGGDYWSRLTDVLSQNKHNLPLMGGNLLRFASWWNVALLALPLAGLALAWRVRAVGALAGGVLLLIGVMAAILPYQGHGFGYRYLHGLLGNLALLAGYGWQALGRWRDRLRASLVTALAGGALVLAPMQAVLAHRLYAPFAAANARIGQSGADYIIIGAADGPYAFDLVLNRADLSNRPIRLSAADIDDMDAFAGRLCGHGRGGRVALPTDSFFAPMAREFLMNLTGQASERLRLQSAALVAAGCSVSVLR